MRALVCERCGGNSFSKLDAFFQCDFCRTKYMPEQARRLMVEGPITIDRSDEAANILMLAEKSFKHGDAAEGHAGAKRVLEIDLSNAKAWFLLGVSRLALGLSALHRREAQRDFEFALQYADESERTGFETAMAMVIRHAASEELWRMALKEIPGSLNSSAAHTPKNCADIFVLTDAYVELLKLGYRLTGDSDFAKMIVRLAGNTIPHLQPTRELDNSQLLIRRQQIDKMLADFELSVENIKSMEPSFKARTPKIGRKRFSLWT